MKKVSKQMALAVTLSVIGGATLFIGGAQAAESGDKLEKYSTDEYVVTATRTELTKEENPRSVEVITKEEIQNSGAVSVRDALRVASDLNIQTGGGSTGDTLTIRGGDDVLVMVDGRRMATEGHFAFISQNAFVLDRINVNNVERIEILRGPDAAIYGSGAQAGIINIITKKSEKPSTTIGFTTGTKEMSNYYRFDSGKQGKLSATFDANFSKVRDLYGKTGENFLYGPKQNYTLDLDYEMDANNKLNLNVDYYKDNLQYFNPNTKFDSPYGLTPFTTERKTAALTYSGKNSNSDYSLMVTYSKMDRDSAIIDNSNTAGREYESLSVEARDVIRTSANNKLVIGAEYRNDDAVVYGGTEKEVDQYGVYLHDEYKVSNKLLLTPSVRYDYHEKFGGNTSPSLGATYFITDKSRFKASYGTGYRAPSLDELYGVFNHGGVWANSMEAMGASMFLYGNPDLKPEKTRGYEVSYEQEFNDNTSAKLTYFKNKKKDAITYNDMTNAFIPGRTWHWINIDEASYEGVEFEIKHDLGNGFVLMGNYDWLDAKNEETGEALLFSARNKYTAKLSWTDPANKEWNVTAWNTWYTDYAYGGSMATSPSALYSINTFNIVVNKRWGDKYRAFVGLDNAFDKDLADMGYYGRFWRAGFEMTF